MNLSNTIAKLLLSSLVVSASASLRGGNEDSPMRRKNRRAKGMMMMASGGKKGGDNGDQDGEEERGEIEAISAWWVFANNPSACISNPNSENLPRCGPRDVYGDAYLAGLAAGNLDPTAISPNQDAQLGIIYATGGTTDEYGHIRLVASAYVMQDPLNIDVSIDPLKFQRGFITPDAEISIVVKRHGPFFGFKEQFTELLDPYCDDPIIGWEGPLNELGTICLESQFAQWAPGTDGDAPLLLTFTDTPTIVPDAKAYLNRRGDAIQVIVETDASIFNSPF
mmetsp:Transcript_20239/g.55881  ORF Transcript_20239/g.55881 Transcript_20239/m.55881 type:complete len:280 (+) Transcript_20239:79-918(+)